jgi:hypothetical protein
MPARWLTIFGCLLWFSTRLAESQTLLKLSTIIPGTERTQLVCNGDFQSQGPLVNGAYASPDGWRRVADMFASAGVNAAQTDESVVALAQVNGSAPVCMCSRGQVASSRFVCFGGSPPAGGGKRGVCLFLLPRGDEMPICTC